MSHRQQVLELFRFFEHKHLPTMLQDISKPFYELAKSISEKATHSDQDVQSVRRLIEAKDCAVRAALPPAPAVAFVEKDAPLAPAPETAWLVEGPMRPDGQTYIGIGLSGYEWVTDSLSALRLSRKSDADAVFSLARQQFAADPTSAPERVCDHEWVSWHPAL